MYKRIGIGIGIGIRKFIIDQTVIIITSKGEGIGNKNLESLEDGHDEDEVGFHIAYSEQRTANSKE